MAKRNRINKKKKALAERKAELLRQKRSLPWVSIMAVFCMIFGAGSRAFSGEDASWASFLFVYAAPLFVFFLAFLMFSCAGGLAGIASEEPDGWTREQLRKEALAPGLYGAACLVLFAVFLFMTHSAPTELVGLTAACVAACGGQVLAYKLRERPVDTALLVYTLCGAVACVTALAAAGVLYLVGDTWTAHYSLAVWAVPFLIYAIIGICRIKTKEAK